MIREQLERALYDMETMARVFEIEPFDLYLLGGSGCVLASYTDRATVDFDFIDLDYSARLGKIFKLLEPFDMVDYRLATIAPSYKERSVRLSQFEYLRVYVLSREDIIVSKAGRLNEKDWYDIKQMLPDINIELLTRIADEVFNRRGLSSKAKKVFAINMELILKEMV
jgi:hypothetical protein